MTLSEFMKVYCGYFQLVYPSCDSSVYTSPIYHVSTVPSALLHNFGGSFISMISQCSYFVIIYLL